MVNNYELYKVFYSLATSLSFTKTAKELSMSQSAVSQNIKMLEKEINKTLFIRTTKKVALTSEGEILLRYIAPAVKLIKHGEDELMEAKKQGEKICIAANDTTCRYLLVPYIDKLHKEYPEAQINVISATSVQCAKLLEKGQADVIICNAPNVHLGGYAEIQEILSFQDVFVANEKQVESIGKVSELKQLLTYPILMLDKKTTTSEFLYSLFQNARLELVPEMEVSSNDLLLDLVRIGLGIAFVPDYCLTDDNSKDLCIVDTQSIIPKRKLILAYNRKLMVSKILLAFMKYFKIEDSEK